VNNGAVSSTGNNAPPIRTLLFRELTLFLLDKGGLDRASSPLVGAFWNFDFRLNRVVSIRQQYLP
jgi:hypothetical protein